MQSRAFRDWLFKIPLSSLDPTATGARRASAEMAEGPATRPVHGSRMAYN
jgi:hypothetical protein